MIKSGAVDGLSACMGEFMAIRISKINRDRILMVVFALRFATRSEISDHKSEISK